MPVCVLNVPGLLPADAVLAVLYGSPGLGCFAKLHATLKQLADDGKLVYVWRPLLLAACEVRTCVCWHEHACAIGACLILVAIGCVRLSVVKRVVCVLFVCHVIMQASSGCAQTGTGSVAALPGWGVEAALKNTEYSAQDDKKAAGKDARDWCCCCTALVAMMHWPV